MYRASRRDAEPDETLMARMMARVLPFLALLAVIPVMWFLWTLITPEAKVERFQVVSGEPGCRAEVWVRGEPGDRLTRLMSFEKNRPPRFLQAVISHENLTSIRLPDRVRTPAGNCEITRWHLIINGAESATLNR